MDVRVQPSTTRGVPRLEITIAIDRSILRVAHTQLGARVSLEGWLPSGPVGGPGLPSKTIWVALPPGYRAKGLHVEVLERIQVTDGPAALAPLSPPRRDVPDRTVSEVRVAARVAEHYLRAKASPAPLARLLETRRLGDTPIALVQLNPLPFDEDHPLSLAAKLRVVLELEAVPEGGAKAPGLRPTSDTQLARLAQMARASVVNPEHVVEPAPVQRLLRSQPAQYDYLVITDNITWNAAAKVPAGVAVPGLVDAFRSLVTWKNGLGFRARVVTVSEIVSSRAGQGLGADFSTGASDLQAVLRRFLQWAYEHWGTAYVLLGGDQNVVPIRRIQNGDWNPSLPTDFYYADLDPTCDWAEGQQVDLYAIDYRCDISVGRVPVASRAQADTFVNRVIAYERLQIDTSPQTPAWLRRVLYASSRYGGDDPSVIARSLIFPPPPNCFSQSPAFPCALIHLQDTIAIAQGSGTNPGQNQYIQKPGTNCFKIQLQPTYKSVDKIYVRDGSGRSLVPHTDQASATTPGWYYTDWLDNDGPCHNDQGVNYPTTWIIVYLAPGQAPSGFEVELSPAFRVPYNLLSQVGDGDYRPIPYAVNAAASGRGWYFAKGALDPNPSAVDATGAQTPTPWLIVYAPPAELSPLQFVLDPGEVADSMTEQERLRKAVSQSVPAWNAVSRLYPDVVDLPPADRDVPEVQYYSREHLRSKLNQGQHIVSVAGHGDPWTTCVKEEGQQFDRELADQLTNAPCCGILYACSCLTNRYTEDSLSRHLVLGNPNGGMVAYIGSMDTIQMGLGHAVEMRFFSDLAKSGVLGIAYDARMGMLVPGSGFDVNDRFVRFTTIMLGLLGDPALRVFGAFTGYFRAAYLFTSESIVLARLGGYANAARNSLDPQVHLSWALGQKPGAASVDLKEKYKLQLQRLAGLSREDAASFFAATVVRLASYGVAGCGWYTQGPGNVDPKPPHDWALAALQLVNGVDVVAGEFYRRVDAAFGDVLANGRHLLEMLYTRESVEMARLGGFANPISSTDNSLDPGDHRSWAWAINTTLATLRDDLVRKYNAQVDCQRGLGQEQAARFYADACLRLNALGVDFGTTSANWQEYALHHDWALQVRAQQLKDALAGRVRRIWEKLASPELFEPRLETRVVARKGQTGEIVGTTLRGGTLNTGQEWVGLVRFVNTGGGEFTISDPVLAGSFSATNTTLRVLSAKADAMNAAEVELHFTSQQAATYQGTLTVKTSLPGTPQVTFALSVTYTIAGGGTAVVDVTPTSLDIGAVKLGTTGSGQVTIRNTGNAPAGGLFIDLTGPGKAQFSNPGWGDPNIGIDLAAGQVIRLDIIYTPTATGSASATLNVTWGPAGQKQVRNVPLAGRGTAAAIASAMSQGLDFGLIAPGSKKQLPVTFDNTGDAELVLHRIYAKLGLQSRFAISGPGNPQGPLPLTPPLVIAAGGHVTYQVEFTAPNAGVLTHETLVVESDAQNAPQYEVALLGGSPGPKIYVQTEVIDFGVVPAGSAPLPHNVICQSAGTTDLTIQSIVVNPACSAFTLPNVPAPLMKVVPAGQSFVFQVVFDPAKAGDFTTSVEIASDDPLHPIVRMQVRGVSK